MNKPLKQIPCQSWFNLRHNLDCSLADKNIKNTLKSFLIREIWEELVPTIYELEFALEKYVKELYN